MERYGERSDGSVVSSEQNRITDPLPVCTLLDFEEIFEILNADPILAKEKTSKKLNEYQNRDPWNCSFNELCEPHGFGECVFETPVPESHTDEAHRDTENHVSVRPSLRTI